MANVTYTAPTETGEVETTVDPATVRRAVPRVGRNEPCPCGSGKKYKHCHGALTDPPCAAAPLPPRGTTPAARQSVPPRSGLNTFRSLHFFRPESDAMAVNYTAPQAQDLLPVAACASAWPRRASARPTAKT
jgi:hypothetical protein